MNYSQERKLNMFWSMEQFITQTRPEILEQIPNFNLLFADFQVKVGELNILTGRQLLQRHGNIVEKIAVREELCTVGGIIAGKIMAYATFVNNYQLISQINYTTNSLFKSTDAKCITDCTIIWEKGIEYLAFLSPYGIKEADLADFKDLIAMYDSTIPKPKDGVQAKKVATQGLRVGFKEAMTILNLIEKQVQVVKVSEPAFYVMFKEKKLLTKAAYRTLAATGTVVDVAGNALPLVRMTCEKLGFSRKVSESGNFRLRNMPDGVYDFVFSRPSYVDTVVELVFYKGIRFEVKVVMEQAN